MLNFDRSLYRCEPTPDDVVAIREEICRHKIAIDAIQERILGLQLEIQQLRREQGMHDQHISLCKGVITLARRIPEELLAKIFEHCVEGGWTRAPLAVSHVCSAWRNAARASLVWSRIYVNPDTLNVLARTRFWLSMACQAPLDITIVTSWRTSPLQLNALMELLLQYVSQWKRLSLETTALWQTNLIISHAARISAPSLQEVNITTEIHFDEHLDGGESDVAGFTGAFKPQNAPKLTTVHYTCNVLPLSPIFPPHIRHLTLNTTESLFARPLSAASIITLLEGLPDLRTLTISMPLAYEQQFVPDLDPAHTVTLPALECLTVYGPTDLNEFLPHFYVPALRRLHLRSLEDVGYRQVPIGPSLIRFVTNSGPPLELLELHDIDLSPQAFAACFTALPELREFRLHESSISDATVQLLRGPNGLCPRLTRLDLRWCGHLSGAALVELVRSRNVVDTRNASTAALGVTIADPIEEVAVINCCFVKEQDVMDLAELAVCRVVMRDVDDYCRGLSLSESCLA
ncbi:hypothetical protein AcW1_004208 [Taiwanofungus camphoratus]|nr:hypothetical protein AcW2_006777 [Antrodia cinnamomea]KAI0939075.1 hypothetical protein AcV5_000590 [Antrodia cinnamomea]KAI0951993.1 hypothetical protein AcV7_007930 [Antrodia cinnamomea]KAI0959365.1 hypothetical protein AcW1_004208 [Antrodia cinnamomea]